MERFRTAQYVGHNGETRVYPIHQQNQSPSKQHQQYRPSTPRQSSLYIPPQSQNHYYATQQSMIQQPQYEPSYTYRGIPPTNF